MRLPRVRGPLSMSRTFDALNELYLGERNGRRSSSDIEKVKVEGCKTLLCEVLIIIIKK